jgi:[ribosomal protein S5]-alanine N-acetyltransferase
MMSPGFDGKVRLQTPTIKTERLLLRPFLRTDAPDVFAYASNPRVSRFTSWSTHRTLADSEAFIDMVLRREPDEHTWAICVGNDPRVQGAIELGPVAEAQAELHYVLAEPLWNRGLMTEAARAVLAWGLASYPTLARVVSRALVDNVASHRVMEHCGMTFERLRRDPMTTLGETVEQLEYALTRPRSAT